MRGIDAVVSAVALAACASTVFAQSVGSVPPNKLREVLKDISVPEQWWYNDLASARRQAEATGKPLMIVFR